MKTNPFLYAFQMLQTLLDLIFPRMSLTGSEGGWITDDERKRIRLTPSLQPQSMLRKRGLKHIDAIVAAGNYASSPLLKKAILTYKYKRIRSLSENIGSWMTDAMHGLLLPPQELRNVIPVLCPVPLHWTRRMHRGFNQATLLAGVIGTQTTWPVRELLRRRRPTGHQAWRKKSERLHALTNTFCVADAESMPRFVILIDDLSTTGATLDECAKVLKAQGVEYVAGLVAALG